MQDHEILSEFIARFGSIQDDIASILFDKQRDVIRDKNTYVAAVCTRRAGKSYFSGARLFKSGIEHKGSISPYIALTRYSARNIMWPILLKIAEKCNIKIDPIESKLTIRLTEYDSEIQLFGADTKNYIERLRGTPYPVAIIDEAGFFKSHIETLVDDVLTPSVSDYNGQIYLLGTPGIRPQGMFYEATQKLTQGFSVHKWSVFDNPHMPHARKFVDDLMKRKNWTLDNPTYQREWLGMWVEDLDALVYKFNKDKNSYKELPRDNDWTRILAVDYGYHDKTAFAVVAYHPKVRKTYVEYARGYSELIPSQIATHLEFLNAKYKPVKIVADTGGLGKSITEEMRIRYALPIMAAQKTDKLSFISLLNGDFIDGNLLVHESLSDLREQYSTLIKNDDGNEDPSMPNDLCDAVLYAWRQSKAHSYIPDVVYKSKEEELNAMAEKLWESDEERLNKEQEEWYNQ